MPKKFNARELLKKIEGLQNEIKKLKSQKSYGLVWEDKPEQVVLDCQSKIPVLKEVKNKEIITDKNKPVNILIEGDNYHSLSVLNYTHKGKIDVIYIDPPYNTGKKDEWKFNDNWVDENDSYRHSKWLNFINKRLNLANDLLNKNGLVFISINDHEQAQLKLLCDSIFGQDNFIANLIWENREGGGSSDSKYFKIKHEYILAYAKNKKYTEIQGIGIEDEDRYKLKDKYLNVRGRFQLIKLNSASIQYSKSLDYPIKALNGTLIYPSYGKKRACWRWGKNKLKWGIENDFVVIKKDKNHKWAVYTKQYLKVDNNGQPIEREKRPIGVISSYSTTMANKQLEDIFYKKMFDYSKPYLLIKYVFKISSKKNSIILDFFAGSGTSGHAILELNKEDGGNRQFILCTNNENKICEVVCYPRVKKVINGYKNLKGSMVKGLGGNLKYFKTDLIDVQKVSNISDENKIKLTYQAGEMIALRENTLEEKEKNNWWQVFTNGKKHTAIYFKEDKSKLQKLVEKLSKLDGKIALYIFSWGKNEYGNEFSEYPNIRVEDIPEPIIEVYKEINKL